MEIFLLSHCTWVNMSLLRSIEWMNNTNTIIGSLGKYGIVIDKRLSKKWKEQVA